MQIFAHFRAIAAHIPAPITLATHVCVDMHTRQIIARGSLDKMRAYQSAFGHCYINAIDRAPSC